MLQQLGLAKAGSATPTPKDDPNAPQFAKDYANIDDASSDDDAPATTPAPSSASPAEGRPAVSWAALVPRKLHAAEEPIHAAQSAGTTSLRNFLHSRSLAPHPRISAAMMVQDMPRMPQDPNAVAYAQPVAPRQMGGGGGNELALLKSMNPDSYKIVQALLAKQKAGQAIPGLSPRA